jgi:hypothetical protein
MNPLVDASLVKEISVKLTEQMQVSAQLFPRYHITNNVTVQVPPELLEQALGSAEAKALPAADLQATSATPLPVGEPLGVAVVMPQRMGLDVIKAWELKGTRVHVEFALLNNTEQLVAIRDVILLIGAGPVPDSVQLKQFVEVTPTARVPSERYRLPVVVGAKSSVWLCAELEGPVDANLGAADRECTLILALNSGSVSSRFMAQGNPIFEAILEQIQDTATEQKGAAAFRLPVSPPNAGGHDGA